MGDHDDSAILFYQSFEQTQHGCRRGTIKVTGRLVREHQRRVTRQRTSNRDPLLLTA